MTKPFILNTNMQSGRLPAVGQVEGEETRYKEFKARGSLSHKANASVSAQRGIRCAGAIMSVCFQRELNQVRYCVIVFLFFCFHKKRQKEKIVVLEYFLPLPFFQNIAAVVFLQG